MEKMSRQTGSTGIGEKRHSEASVDRLGKVQEREGTGVSRREEGPVCGAARPAGVWGLFQCGRAFGGVQRSEEARTMSPAGDAGSSRRSHLQNSSLLSPRNPHPEAGPQSRQEGQAGQGARAARDT